MTFDTARDSKRDAWRQNNLGRLLNEAVVRFERRVAEKLVAQGWSALGQSHFSLTRNLDLDGTRATELARRASMTKQSMGELVMQAEKLGYVERCPDPEDGRARIVRFTARGLEWHRDFRKALEDTEREARRRIGADEFKALKAALRQYTGAE